MSSELRLPQSTVSRGSRHSGRHLILTALAAGLALLSTPVAVAQSAQATFYDLDDDPDAMMLFGLDSIEGRGADRTFIMVNLFRGKLKTGNMMTWHANCPRRTLNIVEGMQFDPASSGKVRPIKGKVMAVQPTGLSQEVYTLACTGKANLRKDKAHFGEIADIVREFWRC